MSRRASDLFACTQIAQPRKNDAVAAQDLRIDAAAYAALDAAHRVSAGPGGLRGPWYPGCSSMSNPEASAEPAAHGPGAPAEAA